MLLITIHPNQHPGLILLLFNRICHFFYLIHLRQIVLLSVGLFISVHEKCLFMMILRNLRVILQCKNIYCYIMAEQTMILEIKSIKSSHYIANVWRHVVHHRQQQHQKACTDMNSEKPFVHSIVKIPMWTFHLSFFP